MNPSRLFCFAGIGEISVDVYKGVEHSDSEDSDKSESSESEYASDEEQKTKDGQVEAPNDEAQKNPTKSQVKEQPSTSHDKESKADKPVTSESAAGDVTATASEAPTKDKINTDSEIESQEKIKAPPVSPGLRERAQVKEEAKQPVPEDSDSERELVIDLGEEQGAKDRKRSKKDNTTVKETSASKPEGESFFCWSTLPL